MAKIINKNNKTRVLTTSRRNFVRGKDMESTTKKNAVSCAVYARLPLSGNDSVHMQLERCRSEAELRGWTIEPHYIFKDEGWHNQLPLYKRAGFSALMKAAAEEQRHFTYVIVDATETLSRSTSEVLRTFTELARHGIVLVAVDPRNPDEQLN